MPISVAGSKARERGFTLIELMIVIAIIGLASAVVVLALPDPRGRLTDEAARFAARTRAAHDLAVVGARPISVWVSMTRQAAPPSSCSRRGMGWPFIASESEPSHITRAISGAATKPLTTALHSNALIGSIEEKCTSTPSNPAAAITP